MEELPYIIFSSVTAIVAVIAVFSASRAMKHGLTYSAMAATMWTLVFFAVGRVWHTVREMTGLEGEWPEMLEYGIYTCGYLLFIWLTAATGKIRLPTVKYAPVDDRQAKI